MQQTTTSNQSEESIHNAFVAVDMHDNGEGQDSGDYGAQPTHLPRQHSKPSKTKKEDQHSRLLGILPSTQSPYCGTRSYDYEEKYAPDPLGDEIKDNARVWKVYLDEAESYDDEMLRSFKDTIDSLLVFAALFSAVVTSFVVSTLDSLQPNYNYIIATLLDEQVKVLRAVGNETAISLIPPSAVNLNTASPSGADVWINGLFFGSLSLSLSTALLSVLAKQWLQAYSSILSGNAKERALIRQFRFEGFQKWKVSAVIATLPLILHASLALFFIGLALYVSELHHSLCWIVVSITTLAFSMYLLSIVIPQFNLACPYRIQLLFKPMQYILHPLSIARWMCFQALRKLFSFVASVDWRHSSYFKTFNKLNTPYPTFNKRSLKEAELELLTSENTIHHGLGSILAWLCTLQSNQSIQRIVVQALHGVFKLDLEYLHDRITWNASMSIYSTILQPYLKSLQQTMWNAFMEINENDSYGCEIWPSVLSQWMIKGNWRVWHQIDIEMTRDYWIKSVRANKKMPLLKIIELSKLEESAFPDLHKVYPTALHDASNLGHLDVIRILLENGANVNEKGGFYGNAIQAAAYNERLDIVQYLVEQGADVNLVSGDHNTPLRIAATGKLDVVKYLVEKGAYINEIAGEHGTALQAAAYYERLDTVKFLVGKGADINMCGGEYGTALQAAASAGRLDIVQFLVENNADVNMQDGEYGSALQVASQEGNLDIVQFLTDNGADVNLQGGQYGNALQAAATHKKFTIVKFLVDNGANVNIEGGQYGTSLQAASRQGYLDIVQFLLSRGANVAIQGGEYGTALQAAAIVSFDIVKLLVQEGADVNVQGGKYGTPLQAACYYQNIGVVEFLIGQGANVNTQGGIHGTALQAAASASKGSLAIIQYLLAKGADVNLKGGQYGSVMEAAIAQGNENIVQYLKNYI